MSSILWLASYPKSGNTWVRALLANYLRDADEPADINELGGEAFVHAGSRVVFDEIVGVEASALEQGVIDRLRPMVYRRLAIDGPENLHVKVHDAWSPTPSGEPLFPADVSAGAVYIVRNPLDVSVSFASHWGVDLEAAAAHLCDESFALAPSTARLASHLRQFVGSWSGHVSSWVDQAELRCHVVRYEDLHVDPEDVFAGIVRFAGVRLDPSRLQRAVAFSDFSELKRQERRRGFNERPAWAHAEFFRRGEVGAWRDELPAGLVRMLVDEHQETMQRFGYLDNATAAG